jgi:two-component system, cell cycle sensor histidine kinase and response regulator CckA
MNQLSQVSATSVASPVNQSQRRTILLVEDEPFVRDATRGILENAGFEVLPAADVPDAITLFRGVDGAIDLVMTDLMLPNGDGQHLGKALRMQSSDLAVLVTSGYSNLESELEQPADHFYFLAKPYSRRSLVEKVERIFASQKLAAHAQQAG